MKICLNGNSHEIEAPMTVLVLLKTLGFADQPVVVELDEKAIFPRDFVSVLVSEGSKVEIVRLAAGG
ncbi:MAG: sulfur carrier protein ThiS [Akkermansiaceae bacterium]|jgi:thiamine biosynthesis protein ThiS|nr:sulfur carrier protein ThiS [Akkermansiaceae bacterium]MBJ7395328.1 sulfur carrier protein ThiS [Akkermansiaceae bacterium]